MLLCLISLKIVFAQVFNIESGNIVFEAKAKTVGIDSEFKGKGNGLKGSLNLTENKFKFVYDLWNLDTGIELRNDHMHENYLETEDYPEAKFSGDIINIEGDSLVVVGFFELHGHKKKVEIRAVKIKNVITARWRLKLSDFNIEIPRKFFFAKLSETLEMSAHINLVENK